MCSGRQKSNPILSLDCRRCARNNENITGDARGGGAPAEPNIVSEEGANRTAGPERLSAITKFRTYANKIRTLNIAKLMSYLKAE